MLLWRLMEGYCFLLFYWWLRQRPVNFSWARISPGQDFHRWLPSLCWLGLSSPKRIFHSSATLIGWMVKGARYSGLVAGGMLAPTVYFLASNFMVWQGTSEAVYSRNFSGLMTCYEAGLPFYKNSMGAMLVFLKLAWSWSGKNIAPPLGGFFFAGKYKDLWSGWFRKAVLPVQSLHPSVIHALVHQQQM